MALVKCLPSFKLIALKTASYFLKTKFDLCDLENQNHDPRTNRLPQAPMWKLYTRFQFDNCKTFRVIKWQKYRKFCKLCTNWGILLPNSMSYATDCANSALKSSFSGKFCEISIDSVVADPLFCKSHVICIQCYLDNSANSSALKMTQNFLCGI